MAEALYQVGWNHLLAILMGCAVWSMCRTRFLSRRPAVCHGLWMLVLLKLVTPSIVGVPMPPWNPADEANDTAIVTSAMVSPVGTESAGDARPVLEPLPQEMPPAGHSTVSAEKASLSAACCPEPVAVDPPEAPPPAVPPNEMKPADWGNVLGALLGFSLLATCVIWLAVARRVVQVRWLLRGSADESGRAVELLREVSRLFQVRTPVAVRIVDAPVAPMLWAGPKHPAIVLPRGLVDSLGDDGLRSIIAHELAHFVRRDHWSNLFTLVVSTLFWWSPVSWIARRQAAAAAEACCDAMALERLGSRKSYAETLLRVVDSLTLPAPRRSALAIPFGQSHSLKRRFEMIADSNVKPRVTRGGWVLLGLGLVCLVFVPARGEEETSAAGSSALSLPTYACPEQTEEDRNRPAKDADPDGKPSRTDEQPEERVESRSKHPGAEVTLELDEPEYFLGENALLHWRIHNAGEEPLSFSIGGDGRTPGANRAIRFKVEAYDEDGKPVPDPYPHPVNMGGLGGEITLKSGEDFWDDLQLLRYREFGPGTYTIKVYHDLGWEELDFDEKYARRDGSDIPPEPREAPVVTTTIRFVMPNAEQARQVVEAMLAMPESANRTWGERGEKTYADFALLRYPVYLPIMKELSLKGDPRGVEAIGAMASPEATAALLELMKHDDDAIAEKAGQLLLSRTPYIHDQPPSRRSYLLARSWTDDLKKSAMAAAWDLLAGDDREGMIRGAKLVQSFGARHDLPRLIDVMDRVLVKFKDNAVEQRAYLRPSTASETLADASRELLRRGARPPETVTTPGGAVAWLVGLGVDDDFRPDRWRETARGLITHEIPFVRDVALRNLPLPLDEATIEVVAEAIEDDFAPVQGAACDLASKAKLKAFGPPLIDVLKQTKNDWVMRAAFRAAAECGVDNDRRLEICVRRMKPRDNEWTLLILRLLIDSAIETNGSSGRNDGNWVSVLPDMKSAWLEFIDIHRKELREGKKFDIAAPPLSPAMFPPNFQLHRSGQDPWPEKPAP